MKRICYFTFIALVIASLAAGQQQNPVGRRLDSPISSFDVENVSMIEALGELTMTAQPRHFGVEEVLRERWRDQASSAPIFSLHLRNVTIREVLDTLCSYDSRYTWSLDGNTINVFPRSTIADRSYLLNQIVPAVSFSEITSADDVFGPLVRLFPKEQLGYMQTGGDPSYERPWSVSFSNITVRRLMNRVAENIGPSSPWIFSGSKDQRFFTFQKGGFRSKS